LTAVASAAERVDSKGAALTSTDRKAPLARLESQIAFASLLARCADIRLAVASGELSYRVTPNVRSLNTLPVRFTARSGGHPVPRTAVKTVVPPG
jgi:hypothetical protein